MPSVPDRLLVEEEMHEFHHFFALATVYFLALSNVCDNEEQISFLFKDRSVVETCFLRGVFYLGFLPVKLLVLRACIFLSNCLRASRSNHVLAVEKRDKAKDGSERLIHPQKAYLHRDREQEYGLIAAAVKSYAESY